MDSRVAKIAGGVAITAAVTGFGIVGALLYSKHLDFRQEDYACLSVAVKKLSSEVDSLKKELAELRAQQSLPVPRTKRESRNRSQSTVELETGDAPSTSFVKNMGKRVTSYQSLTSDAEYADAEDEWADEKDLQQLVSQDQHYLSAMSFAEIDKLYSGENVRQGYEVLKKRFDCGERSTELLWRLAKYCHEMACRTSDKRKKKELIFEGKLFALEGHCADQNNFDSLKWAAIMTGQSTDYLGTKEKIEEGGKFKDLLDKALAMDDKEFSLRHMRGRYAYSVASLSWLERKAATVFYSTPPTATLEDALKDFLSAYEERPEWIENLMFIARIYFALGDKQNAKIFLNKAMALTPSDEAERELLSEAAKLVAKC